MLCAPGWPGSPQPLLRPSRTGPKDALPFHVPRAPSGHWGTTPGSARAQVPTGSQLSQLLGERRVRSPRRGPEVSVLTHCLAEGARHHSQLSSLPLASGSTSPNHLQIIRSERPWASFRSLLASWRGGLGRGLGLPGVPANPSSRPASAVLTNRPNNTQRTGGGRGRKKRIHVHKVTTVSTKCFLFQEVFGKRLQCCVVRVYPYVRARVSTGPPVSVTWGLWCQAQGGGQGCCGLGSPSPWFSRQSQALGFPAWAWLPPAQLRPKVEGLLVWGGEVGGRDEGQVWRPGSLKCRVTSGWGLMKIFTIALALAENGVHHAMRGLAKPGTRIEPLRGKSTLEGPRSWGSGRPHSTRPPTSDTLSSLKHSCPHRYSSLEEKRYKDTHTPTSPTSTTCTHASATLWLAQAAASPRTLGADCQALDRAQDRPRPGQGEPWRPQGERPPISHDFNRLKGTGINSWPGRQKKKSSGGEQ